MSLQKELHELVEAQVISTETAERIGQYYRNKKAPESNRMFAVFGILGALLVGLGIILILAHNWDNLSRTTKTIFAFLPLLIGQGLCAYTLYKKPESNTWRESSSLFLFMAVGACIGLISQIYNMPGSISSFLMTWALLVLPLVYIMRSGVASLFYIAGITWYATEVGYGYHETATYWYWLLLLAIGPFYYYLYKNKPQSNVLIFHNWVIPFTLVITLGTLASKADELMFLAYISMFGVFYLIGNLETNRQLSLIRNGYRVIGALGTVCLLLALSFNELWDEIRFLQPGDIGINSPELWATIGFSLAAAWLFFTQTRSMSVKNIQPIAPVFLIMILIFIIGLYSSLATILVNLLVFAIGILTIGKGGQENHLGILNYGLLIITALTFCRFFDTDLSFVWRGILFVVVGAGFFAANYWMLKNVNNMNYSKWIFPAFALMVLVQLYVPSSMIYQQEDVIKTGTAFKFKTVPVDPYDPFRGKYINLSFEAEEAAVPPDSKWSYQELVYVSLENDAAGFAKIKGISKEKPGSTDLYVQAQVRYQQGGDEPTVIINYPFDRFYMEESKALEAEESYDASQQDSSQVTYALVKVKEGIGVLENVYINDVPIQEVVEKSRSTRPVTR